MMEAREEFAAQVAAGERFQFGENWSRFLRVIDESRIERAISSLQELFDTRDLRGRTFLDIGSGSGLSSLAAHRLGARVTSFDFDPDSVACTRKLQEREQASDEDWRVLQGSVLDETFMAGLGTYDLVYSWGVLHHTGEMWRAIDNAQRLVRPGGLFCLAIYNEQERWSPFWLSIKRLYNRMPRGTRWLISVPICVRRWAPTFCRDLLSGSPLRTWRAYGRERGMSPWRDLVDWVGGLPFEVARPEAIFRFLRARGFGLQYLKTCGGGIGCNEFTFERTVRQA